MKLLQFNFSYSKYSGGTELNFFKRTFTHFYLKIYIFNSYYILQNSNAF